ncbi:hypothetical protein ACWD6N_34155 [Micromonospora sp. NPDC005163]
MFKAFVGIGAATPEQDGLIAWRGFAQPFRPQRAYAAFGPVVFPRSQYDSAVRCAAADATAIE